LFGRLVSLIAAKAYFFCLDTKETKDQVSKEASLPHRACAANQAKPGLEKFAAIARTSHCAAKFPMPCLALGHHCFT
jgi:hypothetical protein